MLYVEALIDAHKERLARFAWAAQHPKIKNRTVTRDVPVKPYAELVVVPFDEAAWIERQRQIPIVHKEPWFLITDGPREFEQPKGPVTIDRIQRIVCQHFNVNWRDMLSPRRGAQYVNARQIAVYLCKQLTTRSLVEIGRRFGNRDHTTIIHAVRKISRLVGESTEFAAEVETLRKQCEAA